MATAEMKFNALIFSLLFIIIGISGILLALYSNYDWLVRLLLGIIGIAIIVSIIIGMKKIQDN